MPLWAISDLHVSHRANREVVEALPAKPDDWLALAGDIGEPEDLRWVLSVLRPRFRGIAWTPGNHDLWSRDGGPRGEDLYAQHVEICRELDVATPEDPYPEIEEDGERISLVPVFTLYDYTFRAPGLTKEEAFERAMDANSFCVDERVLHPDPHPSREAWCHERVRHTEERLRSELPAGRRTVLLAHWPLRRDTVRLPAIPYFSPWCGTELTEDWGARFRAAAVITGHLHVPGTLYRHGVPHIEVSLGYPKQWRHRRRPGTRALREVPLSTRS